MSRLGRINRIARVGLGSPPARLLSIVVPSGGASIVLTFDRAIDADDQFTGAFFAHASGGDLNGANGDIAPGDSVSNSTTITFNTNSRLISTGETITFDYASAGKIRTHANGIPLASFKGFPVTNNA